MKNHAVEMARVIRAKINKEADRIDEVAASGKLAGEQQIMMATVRGLRQAAKIASDCILMQS